MNMKLERRSFLAGGAAAVVGACWSTRAVGAVPDDLEIIDCHTHFYDPTRPEGVPWPAKGTPLYRTVLPQHLRAQKAYRRLTGTVVVEASPRIEDNAWLLDLAKSDPFVVGVVGSLNPADPEFASQVKRFAADGLFRGIRVSVESVVELLDRQRTADLKPLVDHDLALDVNGGPKSPAIVADLARQLPELRIVLNHIGNVRITADEPPPAWRAGMRAAGEQTNVFCKISALLECAADPGKQAPIDLEIYRPYLDVVWNALGAERVIYGSNWPVSERAGDYETLQRIALEHASERGLSALESFCAGNARRAYKWVDRLDRATR